MTFLVFDRYAALLSTPVMTGTVKLVEWIGKSHPVTGTGSHDRLILVANMIGIQAQSAAKAPPFEFTEAAVQDLDLSKPAIPESNLVHGPKRWLHHSSAFFVRHLRSFEEGFHRLI